MPLESHEPREQLSAKILDQKRAMASLIEEIEAVAWYNERAAVTTDEELKAVLIHNRDEEIEHAMMNLEWLRRNFPEFDDYMRTFLFTEKPITEAEEGGHGGGDSGGSLNIGSLRKEK
jgi:hypothetical protein